MVVTDYSTPGSLDPDGEVRVTYQGQDCAGFIDARRKRDGVWEAWFDYSPLDEAGLPHRRRDWFAYDDLQLLDPA